MKRVLLATGVLLAVSALVILVPLALLQHNPQLFAPLISRLAGDLLDRRFELGTLQSVNLGQDTRLVATGLSLGNPAWARGQTMARLERLELRINLASLWRDGPVVIRELRTKGLRLDLQRNEDGAANWHFPALQGDDEEPEGDEITLLLPVVLERVDMQDSRLHFTDADQNETAQIDRLKLDRQGVDGMSRIDGSGLVNGEALTLTGGFGPQQALLTGRNFRLDLNGRLGGLSVSAHGEIDDLAVLGGADLDLEVRAPRSLPLLELLGLEEIRDGPLDFTGRVSRAHAGLQIDVRGSLAEFDLSVSGYLEKPLQADGIDLELDFRGPSMAEIGVVLGVEGLGDRPFDLSGHLVRRGSLLVIERGEFRSGSGLITLTARLPQFPSIDGWMAELQASDVDTAMLGTVFGRKELPGFTFAIASRLSSNPAGVELLDLSITAPEVQLELDGIVSDAPGYVGTELHGRITGDDMSQLAPLLGVAHLPPEKFEVRASLISETGAWSLRGATLAAPRFSIELEGEVDRLPGPQRIEGRAHFKSPNLAAVAEAYRLPGPTLGEAPLDLRADLEMAAQGFRITDIAGRLDAMNFTGSGFVSSRADRAGSRIKLQTSGDDLQRELSQLLTIELPAAPYRFDAALTWHAPMVSVDRLEGDLGGNRVHAELELVQEADKQPAVRGEATIEGDSLLALLKLLGLDIESEDVPYSIKGKVDASASAVAIDPLSLQTPHSDLGGAVSVRFSETPRLDMDLHSSNLRLDTLVPGLTARPASAPGGAAKEKSDGNLWLPPTRRQLEERKIPDSPLRLDWINGIEGRWKYRADRVHTRMSDSGRMAVEVEIHNGTLVSRALEWHGPVSDGKASFSIDARDGANRFSLALDSNRIPLLWMMTGTVPQQVSTYRGQLSGGGATLRELAGSLNGAIALVGRGAKLENRTLDLVMGDLLATILTRLNPAYQAEPYTTVRCHAGAFRFDDGVLKLDPGFAMRTRDVDIFASGAIDLDDESLAIRFDTRPRKGIGLSAGSAVTPYLMLAGNLAHPYLTLDPEGTVISGGAAVATGGMSVVAGSLWRRWQASRENPCDSIISRARKDKKKVYVGLLPEPGDQP